MEPSAKRSRVESSRAPAEPSTNSPAKLRDAPKLQPVFKPASSSASVSTNTSTIASTKTAVPSTVITEVREDISRPPMCPDEELWKWKIPKDASPKKLSPDYLAEDAVLKRKLMFEAGNPPVSSHRGIKLLMTNIGSFLNMMRAAEAPKTILNDPSVTSVTQKIQLHLEQEELTLIRLEVAAESFAKIEHLESGRPVQLATKLEEVRGQIAEQKQQLEVAHQTDARFREYLDKAASIRKLQPYEDLLKQRDLLLEQTKALELQKTELDTQQVSKQPYVLVASWALKELKASAPLPKIVEAVETQSSKNSSRHRKSPKKSTKDSKD